MNAQNQDLFIQIKSIQKLVDVFAYSPDPYLSFTLSPLAKPNPQYPQPDPAALSNQHMNQLASQAASQMQEIRTLVPRVLDLCAQTTKTMKEYLDIKKEEESKKEEVKVQAKIRELVPSNATPVGQDGQRNLENLKREVVEFDQRKQERSTQIGGKTHKCVTIKRVSKDIIVVDHESNQVGFLRADSLAMIATMNYKVEGYLTGALGYEDY